MEPAGAAVGAPEQARVGCRQDHGAISRIHLDVRHRARGQRPGGGPDRVCGRHSRGRRPRAPAVGAAGNAWLPHVEWIAESKEKDVWIRRVHRERTDRGGADGVSEWFPEDHRCGCSGCLPDPPTRSGEIKDVGVHRVRQDTAGTPGVDLCISVAVHRVVGARRTEVHERAARRCREPLRARKGPALADRVPVPLCAASRIRARPATSSPDQSRVARSRAAGSSNSTAAARATAAASRTAANKTGVRGRKHSLPDSGTLTLGAAAPKPIGGGGGRLRPSGVGTGTVAPGAQRSPGNSFGDEAFAPGQEGPPPSPDSSDRQHSSRPDRPRRKLPRRGSLRTRCRGPGR